MILIMTMTTRKRGSDDFNICTVPSFEAKARSPSTKWMGYYTYQYLDIYIYTCYY